jgi:predicted MPP superfamily phosphohydrolase
MHIYVFWRIASVPWIKKYLSLKVRSAFFLVLWTLFLLGRMYGHGSTGLLAVTLEFIGMNWMATLFLISVSTLFVDIVTVFGLLMKGAVARLRTIAIIVGLTLSLIALFQGLRSPVVQKYDVYLSGLPKEIDGKVIVGVSDMHLGSLIGARWLKDVVSRVQSLRPDMIVLLGDIFEGHEPPGDALLSLFHELSAPLGVWAVPGNHDTHGDDDTFIRLINDNGINVLRNTWTEPFPGFYLAGVNDLRDHYRSGNGGHPIRESLSGRPPGGATVLLSHSPGDFTHAVQGGVGLMLSGHTHGGQIWPFDYLVKRRYPLLEGRHEINGMTLIICRGTGTWGPRMRLWSPGEVIHITLHRTSEDDMPTHEAPVPTSTQTSSRAPVP